MKSNLAVALLLGLVKAAPMDERVEQLSDDYKFDFGVYSGYVDL